jgi:hypothetical protein
MLDRRLHDEMVAAREPLAQVADTAMVETNGPG